MKKAICYINDGAFFFPKSYVPSKRKVLKELGVKKGTFAGNMISRVYDYFFIGAVDFQIEYKKYYRHEFPTLKEYIEERYNIESNKAIQYAENNYCMKEYSKRSFDRGVETLIYDKEFMMIFANAIGEIKGEN